MPTNSALKEKIKKLPDSYGIYMLKDESGKIVYVGKSNSIRKRLYSHLRTELGKKIFDIDYIETAGELSALILEAKLIKKYVPKYNVLLRDDKQYPYIKLSTNTDFPNIAIARKVEKDGAKYYGPFKAGSARTIMKILKIFGIRKCESIPLKMRKQPCLDFYMKKCSAPCIGNINKDDYSRVVRNVETFFESGVEKLIDTLKDEMQEASNRQEYEKAATLRNKIRWLESAAESRGRRLEDKKVKKAALAELKEVLGLKKVPARIEAYDVSNLMGSETVGAMVVFKNGLPYKGHYRKFNIRAKNLPNDTAAIYEMVYRRFAKTLKKSLPKPDLIIIDGGKGQLSSAIKALSDSKTKTMPMIGLAKKNEEIFLPEKSDPLVLPPDSSALLLLRRIRDEVHRFAITFHRAKRRKAMSR